MGCFRSDQPSLLEQLVDQLRHKVVSYSVAPVFVTEAADLKDLREIRCNGGRDVEICSFGPALFQNKDRDFPTPCFQCGAVFLIAQIRILFITVNGVTAEGPRFRQLLLQGLDIALIHHAAEAGRVQVEILPVLGDGVTDSIRSSVERPA